MVNDSERVLSSFAQMYFYKELVQDELKYTPSGKGESEIELADLIINFGDVILAIQLKNRDEKRKTDDINKENSWLTKKCKAAKKQIETTIANIRNSDILKFENQRGKEVVIESSAEIVPLVIFMNDAIRDYPHILRKKSALGMDVNCMSFEDFQEMCSNLISPYEIVEYLKWRLNFYQTKGDIDLFIIDNEDSISISKPQRQEALVYSYLIERYGNDVVQKYEDVYLQMFQDFMNELPEHVVIESEEYVSFSILRFFAHFGRDEIVVFIERLNKAIYALQNERYEICGTLRNTERKYGVVIVSSANETGIPMEVLSEYIFSNFDMKWIMEIVLYMEELENMRIDFHVVQCE